MSQNSEFDMTGFLESRKEVAEKIGFFEDVFTETIKNRIMKSYKRGFIEQYYLARVVIDGDKTILDWRKRLIPASKEQIDKIFE